MTVTNSRLITQFLKNSKKFKSEEPQHNAKSTMKPSKVRKASLPGTASTAVADIEEDEEVEEEKVNFFSVHIQMRKFPVCFRS